ncbi:hypothetical protein N9W66_00800 [Luminiphilus sp.]|nr:hypothetical protein [Luminiphilus sp.]
MINKVMLAVALCFSPLLVSAESQSFENFIDAQLVVSDISMTEDGMVITYEGNVGKYGLVHATHNMTRPMKRALKATLRAPYRRLMTPVSLRKVRP